MVILKSVSFQHVLDRAIGLFHFTTLGYAVVGVTPNSVILMRKGVSYSIET